MPDSSIVPFVGALGSTVPSQSVVDMLNCVPAVVCTHSVACLCFGADRQVIVIDKAGTGVAVEVGVDVGIGVDVAVEVGVGVDVALACAVGVRCVAGVLLGCAAMVAVAMTTGVDVRGTSGVSVPTLLPGTWVCVRLE